MNRTMKVRSALLATITVLSMVLASLCGVAYAKYVKQDILEGSVTIKAELGKIELLEHKAVDPDGDGEYELDETEEVPSNTYKLLPGLDIPKDPFVRITGKTPIEAYVYVEVVDGLSANSGIVYSLTGDWTKLDDVAGAHGGTVYVYKTAITNTFGDKGNGTIQILTDNTVEIRQTLDKNINNLKLTFYASMYEVASGVDAADVYKNNTQNNP